MAFRIRSLAVLAACALAACGKEAEPPKPQIGFRVQSVDLGKSVGANKKVLKPATTFAPRDTIYAVVNSIGTSQRVTMVATWLDAKGGTLAEYTQLVAPTGPAATEFHVVHAKGFPVGKYAVTLTANGTPVANKPFEVKGK
ncbi:MAG: hypothetical protein HY275_15515 [Gemmatimonadetes bacterium]|nr:hypothetical protein [Gemmatimonadota bacterium]